MIKSCYHVDSLNFSNKKVILRVDFNVPISTDGFIIDDFRISSTIPTIRTILSSEPKYLILTSHFGRPISKDTFNSLERLVKVIEKYLQTNIEFLPYGISLETLDRLSNSKSKIFLLENLRFHKEETNYETLTIDEINSNPIIKIYKNMGDVFICDAFGCVHRKHMSICIGKDSGNKEYGYGHLINKEIKIIDKLSNNKNKILCIIGGNKIKDKLPIINSFLQIPNAKIFVAGGLAKQYNKTNENTIIMEDGYGNINLDLEPIYIPNISSSLFNAYDIGDKSKNILINLISDADVIFWNGSLGVIEHDFYKKSSIELIDYLESIGLNKQIIIGGGETASLIKNKDSNIYVSTGGGALLEFLQEKITLNKNIVGLKIYE